MIDNNKIRELLISSQKTIGDALKQMDQIKRKLLIVIENDKFKGLLSIGDIQRGIIKGIDIRIYFVHYAFYYFNCQRE